MLEVQGLRDAGVSTMAGLAQALTERCVPTPRGGAVWTHTTGARVLGRARVEDLRQRPRSIMLPG